MASLAGAFQIAYVTPDMARAADLFRDRYATGPFMIFDQDLTVDTPTGSRDRRLKIGLAWTGDTQIELIEPLSGDTELYTQVLPASGFATVFHHIGVHVTGDDAAWDARIAGFAAEGREVMFTGSAGALRFLYTDERATLGHYVEYIQMAAEAFAAWKTR